MVFDTAPAISEIVDLAIEFGHVFIKTLRVYLPRVVVEGDDWDSVQWLAQRLCVDSSTPGEIECQAGELVLATAVPWDLGVQHPKSVEVAAPRILVLSVVVG